MHTVWFVMLLGCIVLVPMLILSVVLCRGRGANLLAGYNSMSPAEQARWDAPAMCRAVGRVMLPGTFVLAGCFVAAGFGKMWLFGLLLALYVGMIIGVMIYVNKAKKFRKK